MNTKQLLILSFLLLVGLAADAQEVVSTKFKIANYKPGIQEIELTFSTFAIGIRPDGELSFIEPLKRTRSNAWGDFEDNPTAGRANLGNLDITYYDNFNSSKSGKIKSIDGIVLDYYTEFDIHDIKGRLKSIGKTAIKYNNSFDIHDIKGTLKSIGDIPIKYNNAFDPNEIKGTIKSVGPVKIGWYNNFDPENLRGKIKSIKGNTPNLYVTRGPVGRG